jgi:hypothetical protein
MSEIEQHYRTLGLEPGASARAVKEAYRDLVKVWHPDRFPRETRLQEKVQEQLKLINIAYHALVTHEGETHTETFNERARQHASQSYAANSSTHRHAPSPPPDFHSPRPPPARAPAAAYPASYEWFFSFAKVAAVILSLNLIRLLFIHCGVE